MCVDFFACFAESDVKNRMAMISKYILVIFLFVASIFNANSQGLKQKPIPIELVVGNNRLGLQSIINKHLPESKKLSFFSVTNFESEYSKEAKGLDFFNNSQISYEIYKGFGVSTGANINKVTGLSPTLGLQYVYANPIWLLVITPTLVFTTDKTMSLLTILEYKPNLTNKLKLYSRVQGLYNQNIKFSEHERSYLQLRLGLDYKGYQFGLGGNLDYFGKNRAFKGNYGLFIRVNL